MQGRPHALGEREEGLGLRSSPGLSSHRMLKPDPDRTRPETHGDSKLASADRSQQ